ncbi:unnamed protein product [Phyllotreta striolata]|uniref:GPI inositol-deacylase n=1 Tax=Phyllotreta striolata TaxID=444603 RepID=A0A9N9TYK0_PHYSR|nr:unnamed protein product [Phyllotreta striolata]
MKLAGSFLLISTALTFAYFLGLVQFLTENGEDKCEMTYMFEYPQFVKISNRIDKVYKRYGLYAYSEGRLTQKTRDMYFDGIPVLFIPGNKGSFKQVRSLSSIALRKWLNSRIPFHFDYFTVDLNDEYSGAYGPLLYDQLNYVNSSVYRILELYKDKRNRPKSIVLIGHSIGGSVALKLLSQTTNPALVPILITLSSPMKRPPLLFDYHFNRFYDNILNERLNSTTLVHVNGGYRDLLILPFLTKNNLDNAVTVATSHIPISWTECDHVQILWCKQVVLAIIRALFDSVDTGTHQISSNDTLRKSAFQHHLHHHSGIKFRDRSKYLSPSLLNSKGKWIENIQKQYSVEYPVGLNQLEWYMVSISEFSGYEKLSILAVNMDIVDWVFACNAYVLKGSSRMCREAFHLTPKSDIAPSTNYKRRFIEVNLKHLKQQNPDLTHVVFRALPTDDLLEYHVDVHGADQRSLSVQLPSWFSLSNKVIMERTPDKSLYFELELKQLDHVMQYYKLYLEPLRCSKSEHHASITLSSPWSHENYHGFVTHNAKKPFVVRLLNSKPGEFRNHSAVIKLILDPSCTYKISIQSSIFGTLGQLARTYSPLLLANVAAVVLMSLRYQLNNLNQGYCSIMLIALLEGAKPLYVLFGFKLISQLFSFFNIYYLPAPDNLYLMDEGTDFFLLPLLLYLCSVGLTWILTVAFIVSLVALESTMHKLCLRLLAATVSFNMSWSGYILNGLHKLPVIVGLTLISLSVGVCGGLALCLGTVFYFLRLTQMSQDFVEEIVWIVVKRFAKKCKRFFRKRRDPVSGELVISSEANLAVLDQSDVNTGVSGGAGAGENDGSSVEKFDERVKENEIEAKNTEKGDGDKNSELEKTEDTISSDSKVDNVIEKVTSGDESEENSAEGLNQTETSREPDESNDETLLGNLDLSTSYNSIFFHSTIFFLWVIVTVINIPAVLTWAHNFKYNTKLTPDTSFLPGVALSFCSLFLWQFDFPKIKKKWSEKIEDFLFIVTIVVLVFTTLSIYRLNYLLTLVILVVTFHQLLAPDVGETEENDENDENKTEDKPNYQDIKMKTE